MPCTLGFVDCLLEPYSILTLLCACTLALLHRCHALSSTSHSLLIAPKHATAIALKLSLPSPQTKGRPQRNEALLLSGCSKGGDGG